MSKYRAACAKFIVSIPNHHDNLDIFDRSHRKWNTIRVSPKLDIVGVWDGAVRKVYLHFGDPTTSPMRGIGSKRV